MQRGVRGALLAEGSDVKWESNSISRNEEHQMITRANV